MVLPGGQPRSSNLWGKKSNRCRIQCQRLGAYVRNFRHVTRSLQCCYRFASFFAEELLKSYPQARFYYFEQKPSSQKWYPSVTVLLEGMSGWRGSVITKLDQFLGYAGLRCYGKLRLGYLRATNGSDLLETVILCYGEHYKRMRHLVPHEPILNYEPGLG
jgi:Sulfotransferase domain